MQGAHNTTTQATRTRKPPTLSPGDQILAVLHQIQEGMDILLQQQNDLIQQGADLVQGQEILLQGQDILRQQHVAISQEWDRVEIGVNKLEQGVDTLCHKVHGLRDDISRRYIFLIPFLHLK